jgi:signal transduction histidine kinase
MDALPESGTRRVRLCDFIRDRQEEILLAWEEGVRAQPVARDLSAPILRDHLPGVLWAIAQVVEAVHTGEERDLDALPELHALDRLDLGFDLQSVVREYALLRSSVIRLYGERVTPEVNLAEVERFDRCVDDAIRLSVARYATARGRTLLALDRFSQAALGSDDLGALLPALLRVVVETIDAVDLGAIFLLDGERLRVAASIGMKPGFDGLELAIGEGFAGAVAAQRKPVELRDAGSSPVVHPRALPAETRALYGVPLEERDQLIGVAYMGSRTAYEFAPEDRILLRAMANRATGIIVHVRLRRAEQAERARANAERRLLEAVVRDLPVAVAVAEAPGGRILHGNAALEAVVRRRVEADDVSAYGSFTGYTTDGRRLAPEEWPLARAVAGERVDGMEIAVERGDGTRALTVQSAAPVRDPSGRVVAGVVAILDITDRKEWEERLRSAGEFRESFLGILSHDLRNLVATVSGTATVLLGRGTLDDRSRQLVFRIARTSERMTRMVRDLLDFTRGRLGGGIPVSPERMDVGALCEEVAEEVRAREPGREIRVATRGDLGGWWDHDRLAQALANLCKNASDYGRPGTPIELRAEDGGAWVAVSVANEGDPIPPDVLTTIFEPYRRASERRRSTGLGLGLYIVQEIARAHGGTVEVGAAAGTVVFTLRLPRDGREARRA